METTMKRPHTRFRKPLAALGKLTVATLVGIALAVIYVMAALFGAVDPIGLVFSAIPLLFVGIILIGWRWAPLLGVLISGLLLAFIGPMLPFILTSPSEPMFAPILIILVLAVLGIGLGIGATVQNYRYAPADRRMPRWLPAILVGVVGLVVGALLVAAIPQPGSAAGISPEALAELPALTTQNFAFGQKEIRAKVGETVALRLENAVDPETHYFELDEFNVHAPIPPGETSLALFKPTKPGTYTFYCSPHSNKATGEGMVGKLIVEP
jgi:plastocyanin